MQTPMNLHTFSCWIVLQVAWHEVVITAIKYALEHNPFFEEHQKVLLKEIWVLLLLSPLISGNFDRNWSTVESGLVYL
jgi:hypothetical protein